MATIESLIPESTPEATQPGKVQYWFACFFAIGWTAVVGASLFHEFGAREFPCPLCVVQRMFMLLAALGAAYIIRTALLRGSVTGRHYMTGWGLALIALMGAPSRPGGRRRCTSCRAPRGTGARCSACTCTCGR